MADITLPPTKPDDTTVHVPAPVRTPKGRRRISTTGMVFAFVLVAGIGYVAGALNGGLLGDKIARITGHNELNLSSVQEVYRELSNNYDGTLDKDALIEGATRGLVDAVGDQYTVFMNSKEANAFDDSLTGNIGGGIGVELGIRNNVPTVLRLLQNNPAEKAGLLVGDVVTAVNGEDVTDKSLTETVNSIRGDVDTTVRLTVVRSGEEKEFNITRAQVNNPSAFGEIKQGVGVLTITRFDDNTASLARGVAREFTEKGVKGVVLDLRGNGGGYVTAAQAVAGIWLDEKLVTTERRGGTVTAELKATGTPVLGSMPTVVLVNQSSASASEIVAGALRDHKKATLVGETTFGKGSVQKLVSLSDQALLKVTIARWYTPNGLNISEKGIAPDTRVERTPDDINANRDPQLTKALSSF